MTNLNNNLKRCTCSLFEAGNRVDIEGGDVDFIDVRTTGCTAQTTRLFAQGHDAKLVSFLVAAEMGGLEIALTGQARASWGSASQAARTISDALAEKARNMVDTAMANKAKRANKAAAKTNTRKSPERKLAEVPTTRQANIKIGRWGYEATIQTDGQATYRTKLGVLKAAPLGTYQEV